MSAALKMPRWLARRSSSVTTGPIGVDLSLRSLHLVQMQRDAQQKLSVRAICTRRLDTSRIETLANPGRFRELLRRAMSDADFRGRDAVIALPSDMFRTMSINYPKAPSAQQESEAIARVMKNRLDGDINDYVIDYLPVQNRSQGDERLALVAVSERPAVLNLLETVRKTGLDVQALEIGPVSIGRLIGALSRGKSGENILVINSGRNASYLTLITGTNLLFDQEVAFGEDALVAKAADTLDMSPELIRDLMKRSGLHAKAGAYAAHAHDDEEHLTAVLSEILKPLFLNLVGHIKRVCLYAAAETRGGSVARIYLLGSIARWPGADQMLSALTEMNVEVVPNPLSHFGGSEAITGYVPEHAPELAVATGAALRELTSHG